MRRINHTGNFADRCIPSSECWPSDKDWEELNNSLDGKLLRDVKPYLAPCYDHSRQDECSLRNEKYFNANFRADIPG